jgi:purine-cytosine permease-like protein
MFQPNPPAPKAMPDAELNAKIAELQLQPDGLVAAMALIEAQSVLRQQDALDLSKWQLEAQMQAASEPAAPVEFEDPAKYIFQEQAPQEPIIPAAEPVIDIFASVAPPTPQPVVPQASAASSPEKIEDIVAALNASYAEVASEPELAQPVVIEQQAPVEPEILAREVIDQEDVFEPAPVSSLPEVSDSEFSDEDTWQESEQPDQNQTGPTRTGFALSWSWLALSATPLSLVLAGVLVEAGASLAQSVILLATSLVATAFIAAVGSMAATRASSALTLVSRAGFGVWGNSLPATAMLLAKIFWSAALIYFATRIISPLIFNQPWFSDVASQLIFPAEFTASMFVLIPLVAIAATLAGFGGEIILRLQQITAIVGVIGIGAFIFFVANTYSFQDLGRGEPLVTTSIVDLGILAFALFGFAVVSGAGDFAKNLPAETPGSKVFFISFVSSLFLPLISGLAGLLWLFMAGDTLGSSFTAEVLATVASAAPVWVFVIFVVALGISLLHLISTSLVSVSGNLAGIFRMPNWVSNLILTVLVSAAVLVPSYLVAASTLQESIIEVVLIAGVFAAAWAGIFVSDSLVRTRGYHEVSLTREYGFYGRFNVANLIGFVLAVVLGLGYLNGGEQLSSWSGFLGDLTPEFFETVGSNIGIAMAFGFAALFPVILGIPRIKKQERNLADLDQRRQELKEFLDAAQ